MSEIFHLSFFCFRAKRKKNTKQMEVTALTRGGVFSSVTMSEKYFTHCQPCLYRFARFVLIGEKSEKCLSRELKGRKESKRNAVQQRRRRGSSSLLFDKVLKGTRAADIIKIKPFYLPWTDKFRQIAEFFGSDPFVRLLLLCCNDVESNPGPLTNLASDDNSSTGSNRSTKKIVQKERPGAQNERSAASNAERLSKFERTLIRNEFILSLIIL